MRILLIGINFGDYEIRIREEMQRQGHNVDYIFDTSKHYSVYRRILGEKITGIITERYHKRMLCDIRDNYDEVIVIVGRQLSPSFLESLKRRNKNAVFTLYLWDDVARVENFEDTKKYYDYIFSFDSVDCMKYGFRHLPLFYTQTTQDYSIETKRFDIYSAMSNHSDRIRLAKEVLDIAKKSNRICKVVISLGRFGYIKKVLKGQKMKGDIEYVATPISKTENYKNMLASTAILDVQYSSQIGLTMRTIECLGFGLKLITTNPYVKQYDFYKENNILVIDRNNVLIDDSFFDSNYETIPEEVYKKYSLSSWVDTILGKKDIHYLSK